MLPDCNIVKWRNLYATRPQYPQMEGIYISSSESLIQGRGAPQLSCIKISGRSVGYFRRGSNSPQWKRLKKGSGEDHRKFLKYSQLHETHTVDTLMYPEYAYEITSRQDVPFQSYRPSKMAENGRISIFERSSKITRVWEGKNDMCIG